MTYQSDYFLTNRPQIADNEFLRWPQKRAYREVFNHFAVKQNKNHAIVSLPTGVGKTGVMALVPYGLSNGRVLIITPRLVIRDHVTDSLDPDHPGNFWLKYKAFDRMNQLPVLVEYDKDLSQEALNLANIVVVNIHKLQKRLVSSLIHRVPQNYFDMVIIDEAHHSAATTWIEALDYFRNAKIVKLTGTPYRTDGQPIAGKLVYQYPLRAAMANGFVKSLENIDYIPEELILTIDSKEYTSDEVFDMGLRDSDWVSRAVAFSEDCSRRVVRKSVEILERKRSKSDLPLKIIGVACSIKHAEQIKELYNEISMKTAILHSDLPDVEIAKSLSDIDNHRVQVVVNVSMLGEGYDHRYLSVGAIFRPFRSQLPYEQFVGRLLRVIPDNENPGIEGNIAAVVSHHDLYLDELWDRYKREIQEAEIIKSLEDLDLDLVSDLGGEPTESIEIDIGLATETGVGSIVVDPYLTTELIKRRQQEEAEDLRKISELQKILDISFAEAESIVKQSKAKSRLLRPDLFEKSKKKTVDQRIKEDIVPKLLADFGIPKKSRSLARSRLFVDFNCYAWILRDKSKDNAALLSIYINVKLKERMGRSRSEWQTSDWDIALQRLDEIEEYVRIVLKDFADL